MLPPVSRTESTSAPVFCALCAQLKFSPPARWQPSNACAILERAKKQQVVCKTSACAAVVLERENVTLLQNQSHPTIWPRPGWRNWQTQRTQNPPGFGPWGFDPPSRHQDSKGLTEKQSKDRCTIFGAPVLKLCGFPTPSSLGSPDTEARSGSAGIRNQCTHHQRPRTAFTKRPPTAGFTARSQNIFPAVDGERSPPWL